MSVLPNRYDIVFFFDVTNGNPNGDPALGNAPRSDFHTHQGLVSDVSLKRRIRNYTAAAMAGRDRFHIYLYEKSGDVARGVQQPEHLSAGRDGALLPPMTPDINALTRFFCENFFDVRAFGSVIDTTLGTSHVRGPVQVGIATSVEPIETARATEKSEREVIPYALFRTHLFINAKLAERTGFDENDLDHLFDSLKALFDQDIAAGRTDMASRRIVAFKHHSPLGNAPAEALFSRVKAYRQAGGEFYDLLPGDKPRLPPARQFGDYQISIDQDNLPQQLEILQIL